MDKQNQSLYDQLEKKHPELKALDYQITFLRDTYTGQGGYLPVLDSRSATTYGVGAIQNQTTSSPANYYLDRFYREDMGMFLDRLTAAHFINYTTPIVDLYNDFVFRRPIYRTTANASLKAWLNQININNITKQSLLIAQLFGTAFTIIDAENIQGASNELEAQAMGYRGLQTTILDPSDIIGFDVDDNGNLEWIKYKTTQVKTDSPISDPYIRTQYRVWTRDNWFLYEKDLEKNEARIVSSGANPFGRVPCAILRWKEGMKGGFLGESQALPLAINNRAFYNRMSELTLILRGQSFSLLVYPTDDPNIQELPIGISSVLFSNPAASQKPEFISPSATNAEMYMKWLTELDRAQFRIGKLEYLRQIDSGRMQGNISSGLSRKFSFAQCNAALVSAGNQCVKFEKELFEIVAAYHNSASDMEIVYPSSYDIGAEETDLINLKEAIATQLPDTTLNKLKKNLSISLVSPNDNELKQIESELTSKPKIVQRIEQPIMQPDENE